ncbi:protein-disulfide reductase DsbD [Paracoccaceae bacterium Fryx2]|nr:protein-disulfide reductase DsbD [Paracoccaceae bacterium Fryx2]
MTNASSPRPDRLKLLVGLALSLLLWGVVALAPAQAQSLRDRLGGQSTVEAPLRAEEAFALSATPSPAGGLVLHWRIAEGYYLYRDFLAAATPDGAALALETPTGISKDDPTFGPSEIYHDSVTARLAATGSTVSITWQGCQEDGLCYPPITRAVTPAGNILAEAAVAPVAGTAAPDTDGLTLTGGGDGMVAGLATRGGPLLVLAGFLGFGLLLAFTPCVFPMFPILAGMLARQGETLTASRGALLSGSYVLAMASAFGVLGMAAAWSGQNLQLALQSPLALGLVAGIFALLALSMFGLFELRLPAAMTTRLSRIGGGRRGSVGGAAVLGFTSALIVGPCVTAPLAGGLLYIAQTGDVALGAGALFALGLGQGIPLFIAGTFGARVLPRAGAWMEGARRVFGFVFLGMAIWLGARLVPGPLELALWAVFLIGTGVFLGAFDSLAATAGPVRRAGKTAGLVAMLGGVILAVGAAMGSDDPLRPLAGLRQGGALATPDLAFTSAHSPAALTAALRDATGPAMVYVTADWCVTCRTIERRVLPDAGLQASLAGLTLIKADVTDTGPEGRALLEKLGAVGPPTVVFLDAQRTEVVGTRLVGDVTIDTLSRSARMVN